MALIGELRHNTPVTVIIGPFSDSTNGDDEETLLAISQADIVISKNAGAFAQKNETTAAAHMTKGAYSCLLDATDVNTLGRLTMLVHEAGALIFRGDWSVVNQGYWDAKYASGVLSTNVTQWLGTAPLPLSSQRVQIEVAAMGAGTITDAAIADNAITANKIASAAFTSAKFAAGAFDAVWSVGTRILTAATNLVFIKGTHITGFNDLSAAQVNAEVDTALQDVNLDHLVGTATGIPALPSGTFLDQIGDSIGGFSTFDPATDVVRLDPDDTPPDIPTEGTIGDAMLRIVRSIPLYEEAGEDAGLATTYNVYDLSVRATIDAVTGAGDFTLDFEGYDGNAAQDGQFAGMYLVFRDGANSKRGQVISTYTGATKRVVFSNLRDDNADAPFPNVPVSGNRVLILGLR
jgi:hypothetical protein